MPTDAYTLTSTQRESLEAMLRPLRRGESFTRIAADMLGEAAGAEDSRVKTLSGYLGEAFRGKRRGLVHVFGEERRLQSLADVLDVPISHLSSALDRVKEQAPVHDQVVAAGLEDLGAVALDDVFVIPPMRLRRTSGQIGGHTFEDLCLPSRKGQRSMVSVAGRAGLGMTTLLMRVASWHQAAGYAVKTWTGGPLPRGRGTFLIGDRVPASARSEVYDWCSAGDRRAILGHYQASPLAEKHADIVLLPVDVAWLQAWCQRARKMSGEARRRLPKHFLPLVRQVIEWSADLGPEAATTLLRWLADQPRGTQPDPHKALAAALARRSARGEPAPPATVLRSLSTMPVQKALQVGPADEVMADLRNKDLSPTTRSILEQALPVIDISGQVDKLATLGLLRPGRQGPQLRFEALLRPTRPPSPNELVDHLQNSPAVEALELWSRTDAGVFRALPWTTRAFERCIALSLVSGLMRPTRALVQRVDGHFWAIGTCDGVPTVTRLRTAVAEACEELGVPVPPFTDEQLAFHLAACDLEPPSLADPRVWRIAKTTEQVPNHWLEQLRASDELASVLLDPAEPYGASWFLAHPGAIDTAKNLLEHLAARSPSRFVACATSQLEWLEQRLKSDDYMPLDMLRPLDLAITSRAARKALRPHIEALRPRVMALLEATQPEYYRDDTPLRNLVNLVLDHARKEALVSEASELAKVVTALAALRLLEKEQLLTLLERVVSGALKDPTSNQLRSRTDAVIERTLQVASLSEVRRAWPCAEDGLRRVARRDFGDWSSWTVMQEYCLDASPPYDDNHPIWWLMPPLKNSVYEVATDRDSWKRALVVGNAPTTGPVLDLRRLGKRRELLESTQATSRWPINVVAGRLTSVLEGAKAPETWARLVAGFAMRCASRAELLQLVRPTHLPKTQTPAVPKALCAVVEAARREDPEVAHAWLVDVLDARPDVADHPHMQSAWEKYVGNLDPLDAYLAHGQADGEHTRGSGVLGAYSDPEKLRRWLHAPATEQAAWVRLLMLGDSASAIAQLASTLELPSQTAIEQMASRGRLDALLEASVAWSDDRRRELWKRAARHYQGATRARLLIG